MAAEFEIVDVWVGRFRTPTSAEQFFAERYGDDDEPISDFAAAMGERFYDHDFMEREFHDPPASDLAEALAPHSFSSSYIDAAVVAFASRPLTPFDTVLLVWNREIERPRSVDTPEVVLHYVGRFRCVPVRKPFED